MPRCSHSMDAAGHVVLCMMRQRATSGGMPNSLSPVLTYSTRFIFSSSLSQIKALTTFTPSHSLLHLIARAGPRFGSSANGGSIWPRFVCRT